MEKAEIKVIRFSENDVIATSEEEPPTINLSGFYDYEAHNSKFGNVSTYVNDVLQTDAILGALNSVAGTSKSSLSDYSFWNCYDGGDVTITAAQLASDVLPTSGGPLTGGGDAKSGGSQFVDIFGGTFAYSKNAGCFMPYDGQ